MGRGEGGETGGQVVLELVGPISFPGGGVTGEYYQLWECMLAGL
jgi:hypothetical protein